MVSKVLWRLSKAASGGAVLLRQAAAKLQVAQDAWETRKEMATLRGLDLLERAETMVFGRTIEVDDDECN